VSKNMYQIACLHSLLYLSDVPLSLKSEIKILCIRKIIKPEVRVRTKTNKQKQKFYEDHDYVVLLCVSFHLPLPTF
jgi:hypothetical protein